MNTTYKVYFNVKNLGLYGAIPGLKEAMQSELVRVYNLYADKTNSGVTDELNKEFDKLYPNYHEDNKDKIINNKCINKLIFFFIESPFKNKNP